MFLIQGDMLTSTVAEVTQNDGTAECSCCGVGRAGRRAGVMLGFEGHLRQTVAIFSAPQQDPEAQSSSVFSHLRRVSVGH